MKRQTLLKVSLILAALLFGLTFGLAQAQTGQPERPSAPFEPGAFASSNFIPIQGRLTSASGAPLNGIYTLTFRLYDTYTDGAVLCQDDASATVTNGLFVAYANFSGCAALDGRQLYLGLQVGTDLEMTPRRFIDNVPYAWSLRPGATIIGDLGNNAILDIENWSTTSARGLRSYAMGSTGTNYGIVGASASPAGFGGYFYDNAGGTGLYGSSDTGTGLVGKSDSGVAFSVEGTGIIKSAAQSVFYVSGNGVRPFNHNNSTIIDLSDNGGAVITRGADVGYKSVVLPISLPGVLYGQNVRVVGLEVFFVGQTELEAITTLRMRRQTDIDSSVEFILDTVDHACAVAENPNGCTLAYHPTTNNELSATSGVLYLTLEMGFSAAGEYLKLGGVRITLEHD